MTQVETQTPTTMTEHFEMLKALVDSMQSDCLKADSGVKSARARARKSGRLLKKMAHEFVRFTLKDADAEQTPAE